MGDVQTAAAKVSDVGARAASVALAAAERANVEIRLLDSVPEFEAASRLTALIWDDLEAKAPASLLRALSHAGNFVAGALNGGDLVGVSIAFLGRDADKTHLHSHITGIHRRFQNRSLGFALKQFQRSWALEHGFDRIQWTADPLVRRNLYFNLMKLGATVVAYYPDFYGPIPDGLNGDGESDRVLFEWDLASGPSVRAAEGLSPETRAEEAVVALEPGPDGTVLLAEASADRIRVWVPEDVVAMRRTDPEGARVWREALRSALGGCLDSGYRAEAITRDGWCILAR
jgi:predicted GNAT superfamily acetyltransferase